MPLFAFLYRATRHLTDAELAERTQVVPAWTLAQRDAGRVVAVSVFGDETRLLKTDDSLGDAAPPLLAGCTLVNARDMDDALALARQFPGRAFGTEVEVRAVKTFVAPRVERATAA
jgi:hypothetical protein